MAQLLDQHGNPISAQQIAQLKQTQAGPTIAGSRPVIGGHPVWGLTPARLAQIIFAADQGNSLAFQELAEDIEERDPHYAAVLATRKRAVCQLPLTVTAASEDPEHEKHAAFLRDWIKNGLLLQSLFDTLDAIAKGYCAMEIDWELTPKATLPKALTYRPQRWFEIDYFDGDTVLIRDQVGFTEMMPHKFVVHRHPSKSGLLMRSGLARVAAWAWMYKSFTARDWATFVQNYGAPIRVGRYGPDSSESDRDVLWKAVSQIAGDCAAIIPKSMDIEFVKNDNLGASAELYEKRCDWLDKQISKLVLGQTATTDANPGSHAAGQTHRLVQEDIERFDAQLLSATITRQLFAPIVAFNFGPQDVYPTCNIGRPDEAEIKDLIDAVQWMGPQGLKVKASELRERLNLSEPDPNDEIVGGRMATPPMTPPSDLGPRVTTGQGDIQLLPPTDAPAEQAPPDQVPPDVIPPKGAAPELQLHTTVRFLLQRQTQALDPDLIDRMTDSLARDAQGALQGLTLQVRQVIESADDLHDMAQRLHGLKLNSEEFATAMQRGIAIANLAGQAALLEELGQG
jgi:phage gp29-like protein